MLQLTPKLPEPGQLPTALCPACSAFRRGPRTESWGGVQRHPCSSRQTGGCAGTWGDLSYRTWAERHWPAAELPGRGP